MDKTLKHHTKKTAADEPEMKKEPPAMVTEVVEEDVDTDELVEAVAPVAEGSEHDDAVEKEEENRTEKSKEVVHELFSKPESNGVAEITIAKNRQKKPLFWWAVIVIVAAITTGIGLVSLSGSSGKSSVVSIIPQKPTPSLTPSSTPTPIPLPKKEDLKVQILNGGGVAGAAGKMKTILEDLGYTVEDVGNTDEYTYDETEVQAKEGYDSLLEDLVKELEEEYTVGSSDTSLTDASAYDIVVIVGKE